ncbi:MAG: hypothetical protein ACI959_002052 [Limisphaerales bacterium]|jgi:hypothetical protein
MVIDWGLEKIPHLVQWKHRLYKWANIDIWLRLALRDEKLLV